MATKTKKRGSATIPEDNSAPQKNEIPQEKTAPQPSTDVLELEAEVVDNIKDQIGRELAKFGRADSAIARLKEVYSGMKINGIDDKEGYKAVRKAWSEVRGYRTGIEKKKKEIKGTYIQIGKAIDGEEERLLDLIRPLEDELDRTWRAIDEEKEAEEKRKEEEEQNRLNNRVTELMTIGLRMNSGYYQLGDTITIDVATLRSMPDENYSDFLGKCQKKAAEIKEEEDRQRQAKIDEENRLENERKKLAEDRKKLEDEKAELDKLKKEKADLIRGIRIEKMAGIGMKYDPQYLSFSYWNGFNGVTNQAEEVFALSDDEFKNYLDKTSLDIKEKINAWEQHKIEVEKEKELAKKKSDFIFQAMTGAGLTLDNTERFVFKNEAGGMQILKSKLMSMTEEEITAEAQKAKTGIDEYIGLQKKNEEEKKKAEENERLESMSDADIWTEELESLSQSIVIDPTKFKTKKMQTKARQLFNELQSVLGKYRS